MLSRTLILGATVALVTGTAGAAPSRDDRGSSGRDIVVAQATPQTQTLTGAAAINAVIGNTLEFSERGRRVAIYLAPDGTVRGAPEPQAWYITGGRLCIVDQGRPVRRNEDCVGLVVTGDTVDMMDGDRRVGRGQILRGNPGNL